MHRLSLVLLAALAFAGCKKEEVTVAAPVAVPAVPAAQVAAAEAAPAAAALEGKVLERLDAPPYSYLRLQTEAGEAWAAVPQSNVARGAAVVVVGGLPIKNFESKTLKRKFDVITFGTLGTAPAPGAATGELPPGHPAMGGAMGAPGSAAPGMGAMNGPMPPHGGAMGSTAVDVGDVKVPRAAGPDARTVAEIHAQRAALKDRPVTLRGKVVKFNPGILGKNWLHLRDGTGTAGKDNDITVTSQDTAGVGDVVVVKGKVAVDLDIGMGTPYPVIIQDAKVAK